MQPPVNAGDTRNTGSIPGSGRSPGLEDPLAKGMATRSSQYSRLKIPQPEEPGGLQPTGVTESQT